MRTPRHGTRHEYNLGCRCDECRAENARTHREWGNANRDHVNAYAAQWNKDNPEKRAAHVRRYRATEKGRAALDRGNKARRMKRADQRALEGRERFERR